MTTDEYPDIGISVYKANSTVVAGDSKFIVEVREMGSATDFLTTKRRMKRIGLK
jgi:hypothetical protein